MIEFQPWPKIARLNRDIVITEKIDGTNAAVIIEELTEQAAEEPPVRGERVVVTEAGEGFIVAAQSRKRLITPEDDNFGFAGWVFDNAAALVDVLGPGRHFGEWWGSGIQRGYGLPKGEKRFSLFNTKRFGDRIFTSFDNYEVPGLRTVPIVHSGEFSESEIKEALDLLRETGSFAEVGFKNPEGIVVYHTAANQMFKVTLENDEAPKSLQAVA